MMRAPPRKNVKGDTLMRAFRIGTSQSTRLRFCSSMSDTGSRLPGQARQAACEERGTFLRNALPVAIRAEVDVCGMGAFSAGPSI